MRRSWRQGGLGFCAGLLTVAVQGAQEAAIKVVPVQGAIHMLVGQGGNIGLFAQKGDTFLVDDQFAPVTPQIVKAIESVGGSYPRFLLNTHYHPDHTGGNEIFGAGGALIVSHHNVRKRLKAGSYLAAFDMKSEPMAKPGLPELTFANDIEFHLAGGLVRIIHAPGAHTDGDSFIHFPDANVIHAGDLFFNGIYPFVDVAHGGRLAGMIAGVDQILEIADEQTRIIPGHGALANKADLETYRSMLQTALERLSALKAEGKTAQEAMAAEPLKDLEETWGNGMFNGSRWIEIIYEGV